MSLLDRLAQELPELIELRRHLHAHPELSGEEHQTAALVAGELRAAGWRVQEAVGRTGVVAELGPEQGPTVGLRVDMDALPVEELTGLPYASTRQGVMHACGHDLHTCIGLGVARLFGAAAELPCRVRLLFQPAAELARGGTLEVSGALRRVQVRPHRHPRVENVQVALPALTALLLEVVLHAAPERPQVCEPL